MSTVNIGWLKDSNGEKFAPKTLSSQVINSDGIILEDVIQTKLNELENDIISNTADKEHTHDLSAYETKEDAQIKFDEAKDYTDSKTSGMATTTVVDNKISTHNTSDVAHSDIRNLISALTTKVNNFLDVDDTTTDQLSEVLELIENNKGTLESLTSGKVNVSDIVDNLTTANVNKVLSANQGVALKALIDALQTSVDGKANSSHIHSVSHINDFQNELNNYEFIAIEDIDAICDAAIQMASGVEF